MVALKSLAFFGLLATSTALPQGAERPERPDRPEQSSTPFELRQIVTTQYKKGDTSFSFTIMDPDSQRYGRCSTVWKSSGRPTAGWIECTNDMFAFHYDDYHSLTSFDMSIRQRCSEGTEGECRLQFGSAGFVSNDTNWRTQTGGNGTTSAYYKGLLAVPVHTQMMKKPE